jgi:hypothetical protein
MRNRRDKFARAGEQSLLPYPLTKHSLINGVQVFRDFLNEKFCFFSPDSRRQEVPDTNYSALYPKVNYMWPNSQPPVGPALYYTNASGDGTWENLANWNTSADGSGYAPTEIPWTETDGSTSASNLIDASGGAGVYLDSTIDPSGNVSGTCNISQINYGNYGFILIYGGTFTGDNLFNSGGFIYGGTFSGTGFTNWNIISGGSFTGSNFTNQLGTGLILGGAFSGDTFLNNGTINGGTFTGDYFDNYGSVNGTINGGTFTGDYFNNNDTINGGTFTGDYFDNNDTINGGTFTGDSFYSGGTINGGTFTGDYFGNAGTVNGGTFTGDYFGNAGTVNGGTFTGDYFDNYGSVNVGTFTGDYFDNFYGTINGGTFNIDGFENQGTINYPNITINLDGVPYTGVWEGQNWIDGVWDSVA